MVLVILPTQQTIKFGTSLNTVSSVLRCAVDYRAEFDYHTPMTILYGLFLNTLEYYYHTILLTRAVFKSSLVLLEHTL